MKKLFLASLGCASVLALLPETGYAHGGQYRGPGDVVPPNPGGGRGAGPGGPSAPGPGGPSTPGPGGPAGPGPSSPGTGGPAGPAGSKGPTTGGRGAQLDDDLTQWSYWWEFNKDPFIRLKDAIHSTSAVSGSDDFFLGATRKVDSRDSMSPSEEEKLNVILPALKKAIDSTDNHDINSSCMVAMAKIGKNHDPDFKLRDVFLPRLKSHSQEIRETAALSFGIAALPDEDNLDTLVHLAADDAEGRKVSDAPEINDRTRSFACYGLGLVAYAHTNTPLKRKAFEALKGLVDDDRVTSRNIKVAAINGIGLLNANPADADGKTLIADALKCLEGYYMKSLGAGEQLIQAHVPTAVAKLLGRNFPDEATVKSWKDLLAADLAEKGKVKRSSHNIAQSCALALGQLCKPCDDDKAADAQYCKLLLDTWHDHKDLQTRYFAVLSLGQVGGNWNRTTVLKEFDKAGKSPGMPWTAMSLGVYSFNKYEQQKAAGRSIELDDEIGRTLQSAISDNKNPEAMAALAVALGLCQYKAAADDMRSLLAKNLVRVDLAGYLCIGLALMGDERSKTDIRDIVEKSIRKPELLKQAAIALGKLGDKEVATELQKLLVDGDQGLAKMSAVASALGFIGDRRTIEPLKQMLANESLTELTRAFAAVALGGVGDKDPLPWNSKIGTNMNYRAAVETLTDKVAGILDIL